MVDEHFLVRTGILQGFAEECRARGVDALELVNEIGLAPEILEQPDLYIDRSKNIALLTLAARRTNCPTFGLELAKRQDQSVIGALLHLISQAATVGESLDLAEQYLTYHLRGARFSRRVLADGLSVAELELGSEVTPNTRVSADLSIVHIERIIQRLCGDGYELVEVWMTHPEPDEVEPYADHFEAPIRWEQPVLGVVLPTRLMASSPAPVADMKTFLLRYVEEVAPTMDPDDLAKQTRAVLRSSIGRTSPTIEMVSAALNMHVRELQRELKSLGVGFRELRDEMLCEYACAELRLPDTSVQELALTLGYSDSSAFSRAFKRWKGMSPSAWRTEVLQGREPPQS